MTSLDLMQQLLDGLQALQSDYVQLYEQHTALEHKLTSARDQYNDLAKLYGKTTVDTPPLSLASISCSNKHERPLSAVEILSLRDRKEDAARLAQAHDAAQGLIVIAGRQDLKEESRKMPSISESPMEQDFTVPGTPSQLGCPFASMTGKKLSSHAASVLSRYHGSQQETRASSREAASRKGSGSRAGSVGPQKHQRRSSILDPVKAEICGLDTHSQHEDQDHRPPEVEDAPRSTAEGGVCPIRFLNQHSPEELALYFEKHKHELPRSHEVCVRRYQSNEEQVRELDARYGNVAQMIRSLGEKHQSFLPDDPDDDIEPATKDDTRVEQWTQDVQPAQLHEHKRDLTEERVSHFERPLSDVRLGESPSRPWGIHVPPKYHEREPSSVAAPVNNGHADMAQPSACPFAGVASTQEEAVASVVASATPIPVTKAGPAATIFNGPIVVGYKPEEAAAFLKKLGYLGNS